MIRKTLDRWLHWLFDAGIVIKGINGALEIIAGLALLFVRPEQILWLTRALVRAELTEDPRDRLAQWLLRTAVDFTPHAQFVSEIFLLSHGLLKVFLVYQLFRGRKWAYPFAIVILGYFVAAQCAELWFHPSPILAALTVLDAAIAALAWYEWQRKMKKACENK